MDNKTAEEQGPEADVVDDHIHHHHLQAIFIFWHTRAFSERSVTGYIYIVGEGAKNMSNQFFSL